MKRNNHLCTLNLAAREAPPQLQTAGSSTQNRLAEAFSCLVRLELERARRQDAAFCKFLEERIIWRELLDLELQDIDEDIDENIGRIRDQARTGLD